MRRGFLSNSCTRGHKSLESIVYIVHASKRVKNSVMGVGFSLALSLFLLPLLFSYSLIAFRSFITYRLQIYFLE